MTLTCKTRPPPQNLDAKLQFLFYKNGRVLGLAGIASLIQFLPWKEDSEISGVQQRQHLSKSNLATESR